MTASRTVRFLCLLGVTILALLRLVQLSSDPPLNITTSGVLYTDEGQYSRNAVHWVLTGQWYTPGDFNPAIIYPVATAIQMLAFRLLGLSTASARAVTVLFSWLTLLLTYRICRYYVSTTSSLVAVLLLAASYRFFAFSRLALLDIPMIAFALSSLALAIGSARRRSSAGMALSATAFMCCWLTKFGVYLFPVIVYAILIESRARRHAMVQVAAWLGVSVALFATCYLLLASPYYDDYRYVMQAVFGRVRPGVLEAVRNSVAAVYHALLADPVLATAVLGSVALLLFSNPSFRASPLLRIAALWTLCRILSLGTTSYQPPRYFLPIHVPLAMATACIVQYVRWPQDGWTGRPFFALLVLVALVLNTHAIVSYMTDPRVTFSAMCADIEQRVVARPGQPGPVLMGNLADSISLATGIPAVNDRLGTADLATRVRLYAPTHYVSLGPVEPATEQVLRQTGDLSLLSKYDVYGNYYTGEPVYLYGLDRRW